MTSQLQHKEHYCKHTHYNGVIMGMMASQITCLTIVYSTIFSDADQRKHQSSTSLVFLRRIHRASVNSPHKWPVTLKMFPFDDIIMMNWTEIILKIYGLAVEHNFISLFTGTEPWMFDSVYIKANQMKLFKWNVVILLPCPDSKVHGANMGPIWGPRDPGGPHVGPMIFAILVYPEK